MSLDQTRAADLEGVPRWRTIYHHHDDPYRTETVAWFHVTAEDAWADAIALLPPPSYHQPIAITVERGTYMPLPEGGYGWQPIGPTHTATNHNGQLTPTTHSDTDEPTPIQHDAELAAAGQQHLF